VRVRDDTPPTPRGLRVALIFALAAHRLSAYYEHGQWLTDTQGASLAADWLARSKNALPLAERRHLSALSDQLARQVAGSLSREAGLYAAHEMTEALDPNYQSELAQAMLAECENLLDGEPGVGL
jgi:non-ribosomal peptide synthetase component F